MLDIEQLAISYHNQQNIIEDFNLYLGFGDILAMLGDSGSGKTSVLKAIAGFGNITNGTITLDNKTLDNFESSYSVLPEKRNVGMVFQDYALFVHLTVEKNIAFGLNALNKSKQQARVIELLQLIDLPDIAKKYPHQLSGGEQQRVALARSIAPKPKLLLLDEPFSNLDASHRKNLMIQVRYVLKQENMTSIFVTHSKEEATMLADKNAYIHDKRLIF